jgi:hypothetical protein
MTSDPLQSLLCWYAAQIKSSIPYYEPIRALPIPEKGMPSSGTHKTDRTESMIIHALDSSDQMEETLLAIRAFLYTIPDDDRRFVEMLTAYPLSTYQFDVAAVALVLIQRETGICARPYPAGFRLRKARRKAEIEKRWCRIRESLAPLLVLYRGAI